MTMRWMQFSWVTRSRVDKDKYIRHVKYARFDSLQEAEDHANNKFIRMLYGETYRCDGYAAMEDVQKYASNLQVPPEDSIWDIIKNPIYYGKD